MCVYLYSYLELCAADAQVLLLSIWQFGSSMLIFLSALKQIPASLYEAAEIDGANKVRTFFKITLPLLTPTIFFNLVMQMINGFLAFTQCYIITQGKPMNSTLFYTVYMYQQSFEFYNTDYGAALAWITVCELIRKQSQVPIIMLTALNGEEEQIRGLDLQVDDYITKPFSMPILVRKIGAVLRRSSMIPEQEHQTITYKNLVLDMDSYTAVVDGVSFDLTQREFEVLRELLLNQGRVLTRQNLLDKLWKYDFYGDERVVDTHIKNLRKKLGIDFIQTIRGVGYKIDKEN